ncbi:MAG: type II toxin-antitoxin system CcdA family antitoxin [Spirochaetaceae bacterium]
METHTKKRTNVSIDAHLLEAARSQGIRLSALLEEAIRRKLADQEKERWLAENRQAIEAYNEEVPTRGVFSDGLRSF